MTTEQIERIVIVTGAIATIISAIVTCQQMISPASADSTEIQPCEEI